MKRFLPFVFSMLGFISLNELIQAEERSSAGFFTTKSLNPSASVNPKIIANPLNLNYRFATDEPSRREAADPEIVLFKGMYYLFASKSGGYWSSTNLADWTFIPCRSISTIENYAPTALALGDTLYYLASGSKTIHYTLNPNVDDWRALENCQYEFTDTDPALFKDDETGRVYVYFGCSDKEPLKGVELDPANGFRSIGKPVTLIEHHPDIYGWERPGENNEKIQNGWNEGANMLKHNGKYYLQYAAPGTEFRTYGDGVYVADAPLGPFKFMAYSPFSLKPGGFIGGAGHGGTFRDKYGNFWHIATMKISQRHMFERRLGLFPVFFDADGSINTHTVLTDYPIVIPDRKVDFSRDNLSAGWKLLSYGKKVQASSTLTGHEAEKAVNEQVEDWWAATSGGANEWLMLDLDKTLTVNAIQVNFADEGFTNKAENSFVCYRYRIEASRDGEQWTVFADRTQNTKDMPHELIVAPKPVKARFLRIVNTETVTGKFSISGFRVFGDKYKEQKVKGLKIERETDRCRYALHWDALPNATGYIVRWGISPDKLHSAAMAYVNNFEAGFFNSESEYFFSVVGF
jgi:hypothetical protein